MDKLAEKADLSVNYVGDLECGVKMPSLDAFIRIVEALDVPADVLIRDSAAPASYVADDELNRKLSRLTPGQKKAATDILNAYMPYSLHRVLDISKYQPMAYVLAPENKWKLDQDMLFKGEKPEAWLDVPIDVDDYEIIDLFNWQNSVKDMISQIEFVRMVDVQSETVDRYIKDGKIKPDLSVPFGDKRMFRYFREESVRNIAKQYGWDLITPQNMADKFMKFIETMDMSFSYKPVLLKAVYEYMDSNGRVALPDVVDYFIDFYEDRKAHGMIAEKPNSIYQKGGYTKKDVEKNILSNPFKRFEDMCFLMRCKDVETVEVNPIIFRKLTREDWLHIVDVCDKSLEKYYMRFKK